MKTPCPLLGGFLIPPAPPVEVHSFTGIAFREVNEIKKCYPCL